MMKKIRILLIPIFLCSLFVQAQQGLEDIFIETYYESQVNPFTGDSEPVTTYRVYVDLAEGYNLQAVYGNSNHPMFFESSQPILNQTDRGAQIATWLDYKRYNDGNLYLDSYLTMSVASNGHCGVPLKYDSDGSLYPSWMGDGCPKVFQKVDGLMPSRPVNVELIGLTADAFGDSQTGTRVETSDGCWALMGSVKGATPENCVLIAQVTTTGTLSFELNLQVGKPDGKPQQFVARNPQGKEVMSEKLIYPRPIK